MSVSMFTNALRTQSRLRVLTATRVALPATRSISSLVAFRTTVPKNVSLSVSRSFTTSQVARRDEDDDYSSPTPKDNSTSIFVANIPWSSSEEDLAQVFSEFGEIKSVRLHMNAEGRPRGICHIHYESRDSAIAAIESAGQEPIHMAGRDLRVDFSSSNRGQPLVDPSEKLYFSGCTGDESDIKNLFGRFASQITDVHLLRNSLSGERTPTGFVTLVDVQTATEAIENLHGIETPEGSTLNLSYARARKFQPTGFSQQDSRGDFRRGVGQGSYGQGFGRGSSEVRGRVRRSSPRWENDR